MHKLRDFFKQGQPWIMIVTYGIVLWMISQNMSPFFHTVETFFKYLEPFFLGIAIAFVLNIPMKQCQSLFRKHTKNLTQKKEKIIQTISIVYAFLLAFAVIGLFGYLIVPPLINSISSFITNIVNFVNGLLANTDQIFTYLHLDPLDYQIDNATIQNWFAQMGLDWKNILTNVGNMLTASGTSLLENLGKFTTTAGNWFLAMMLSIYMLSSKTTLIRQAKKLVAAIFPIEITEVIMTVFHRANLVFTKFISGQLVEAMIIGILEYIVMLIFRIPYAVLIACIVTIMALVPVFGATLACVIGFILVFSVSPWQAILFIIIYQCTQQFENAVIYPKVVGKSVGLPGIWTLLSIVVFGGMYGVMGMLVAVPLTALIYSFGSELINHSLKKKNLTVTTDQVIENNTEKK